MIIDASKFSTSETMTLPWTEKVYIDPRKGVPRSVGANKPSLRRSANTGKSYMKPHHCHKPCIQRPLDSSASMIICRPIWFCLTQSDSALVYDLCINLQCCHLLSVSTSHFVILSIILETNDLIFVLSLILRILFLSFLPS